VLKLGLTGGIGAGKSTVAERFAEHGAVVVDADRLAREVVEPGTDGLAAVVAEFGSRVLTADGALDRAGLGRLVFGDPEALGRLNAVLHPRIAALTAGRIAGAGPDAILVHDVPLLVENRMGAAFHLVLVVHVPVQERVLRLVRQRGLTEDDARSRIKAQADDAARRAAADVWLDNSGPRQQVRDQVDRLWAARIVPFAENLGAGRPAARPAVVQVVDPDPSWADQGRRLAQRVARAAGAAALRVDHHGSTAVPGLAAEDVVDLQLVLPDLATADPLRGPLEDAGFARRPGRSRDDLPGGSSTDEWVHVACDPGRPVNLHVRPAAGPAWREALLLRDFLRAHHDERDRYAAVERAAAGVPIDSYLAAKGAWVPAALERARAWAARVGWTPGEPSAGVGAARIDGCATRL
jgi:dephospho-CoA kinase